MIIFPAIDLKDGKVVRLTQGDYNRMEVYSSDPTEIVRGFIEAGATHLHVVDLDGAKDGVAANFEAVRAIAAVGGLFIQVGGGLRDQTQIQRYFDIGVSRAILGTVAITNFSLVRHLVSLYGDKIAVGVDARNGMVSVKGWMETTKQSAMELCQKLDLSDVSTIIYTDIARDGAMNGANLPLYKTLSNHVSCRIIASGGISSLEDVTTLRDTGIYGAILGKALYTGALSLKEVLSLC